MTSPTPIDYEPAFARNVRGQLYARFRLGPDGTPEYSEDPDGLRHYPIAVFLDSSRAADIDEVTYTLEAPLTFDPDGTSRDAANDFREEFWSYGDAPVLVRVKIGDQVYGQRAWLSNMLEHGHSANMSASIRSAIQRIRVN
jgi:hypothetical protein